jgi:predicted component of type VI protein secretion system
MAAQLIALSEGPDLPLDRPILLVGRYAECDLQLNSGKVSRRHCVIAQVDGKYLIRDLGSTNGVQINGELVEEGTLHHGDQLTIGNFQYRMDINDTARSEAGPPDRPAGGGAAVGPNPAAKEPLPRTDNGTDKFPPLGEPS